MVEMANKDNLIDLGDRAEELHADQMENMEKNSKRTELEVSESITSENSILTLENKRSLVKWGIVILLKGVSAEQLGRKLRIRRIRRS